MEAGILCFYSLFHEFEYSLFQKFDLFLFPMSFGQLCEIHEFGEICGIRELHETSRFRDHCSGTGYAIGCQAVRKVVLCIDCFAYSLLLLLLSLVVVLFALLSY